MTCNCNPPNPIGAVNVFEVKQFKLVMDNQEMLLTVYYCAGCKTYFMNQVKI